MCVCVCVCVFTNFLYSANLNLRRLDKLDRFSDKKDTFGDFLFAYMHPKTILKRVNSKRKEVKPGVHFLHDNCLTV